MEKFQNIDEVKAWLKIQPKDVCVVFAARAALRAVPVFASLIRNENVKDPTGAIILPSLWAMATALSAGRWPDKAMQFRASSSSRAAASSRTATSRAATSRAAYAADASRAAAAAAADAADAAASRAAYAADASRAATSRAAYATDIYSEYAVDQWEVEKGGTPIEITERLALRPLWRHGSTPDALQNQWRDLRTYLLSQNQDWQVWTNWYDDRLVGNVSLIKDIEIGDAFMGRHGRITFPPEDYQDPAIINPKIKAVIDRYWAEQKEKSIAQEDVKKIAEATPLAETIDINFEGKFEVKFLPVTDLLQNNIARLAEAIQKSVGGNGFNAHSEEILILQDMLDNHADNPQRIYDECEFMQSHISTKIEDGFLDKTLGVKRLLNTLEIVATDIRAHEPDVQTVIKTRANLRIQTEGLPEGLPAQDVVENTEAVKRVMSEHLGEEVEADTKDLLTLVLGKDRADAIYRLASRYSRITMEINHRTGENSLPEATKIAMIQAQPHLEQLLMMIKPYLTFL